MVCSLPLAIDSQDSNCYDMAYHFFYLMETELHNHLSVKATFMESNLKLLNKQLSECDQVLYQWHTLTDDQGTNTF